MQWFVGSCVVLIRRTVDEVSQHGNSNHNYVKGARALAFVLHIMSGMCTLVCNLNPTWKTRTPASMETTLERSTFTIQTDCFQYSITCSDRFFFFFLSRRSSHTSRRLSLFWRLWLLKMTSWWIYVERSGGRNAKLNTNHFKHLSYLLHFTLLGFLLSKQIFSYLIMHLTDVQINLGIFTKTLVCDHTSHLPPPPPPPLFFFQPI